MIINTFAAVAYLNSWICSLELSTGNYKEIDATAIKASRRLQESFYPLAPNLFLLPNNYMTLHFSENARRLVSPLVMVLLVRN